MGQCLQYLVFSGQRLGNGTDDVSEGLVFSGIFVYVGGDFTGAGGMSANDIARWNGVTWESLGSGTANGTSNVHHPGQPAGTMYMWAVTSPGRRSNRQLCSQVERLCLVTVMPAAQAAACRALVFSGNLRVCRR